jgi:PAS domain S-box-containing protein
MEPFPLRVLVVEHRTVAREVLVTTLTRVGFEVVGLAEDATGAIEVARRTRPDVALIDALVPGGGVAATEGIVGGVEGCRVLAMSALEDRPAVLQMLLAGAGGYLVTGTSSEELATVVRRAALAEAGLSVEVVTSLVSDLLHEIADLTEIEERLRRSEERFRSLLEAAPDGIVIVNRQGQIVFVNRQTELLFGYARADLLGRPMEFLVPERFHVAHIAHRQAYLAEPRTRRMGAVRGLVGRRMNAAEFPVDISLSTLESDEGPLVIAFVRDLSEREAADAEARGHAGAVGGDPEPTIDLVAAEEEERTSTCREP